MIQPKLIPTLALVLLFMLGFTLSGKAQLAENAKGNKSKGVSITQLELDLLPGPETTSVGFRIMTGYRFNPVFSAGIGTGFTFYHDPLSLVPVFLTGSYRFSDGDLSPFISLKLGYSISILSDTDTYVESHRGGLMLNPAVGVQIPTKYAFGLQLSAGYRLDRSGFNREGFDGRPIETDITYRRFMAGIGFSF